MLLVLRPLPRLLYILAFASTSGKVLRFIHEDFSRWERVFGGGNRSLGFPRFHIAFLLLVLIVLFGFGRCGLEDVPVLKKAVVGFVGVGALARRVVRLVVAVVIADFLFLLWRSWSERGLRAGQKKAVFLQFWGETEAKRLSL